MLEGVTTAGLLVIVGGYILITFIAYGWGRSTGIKLGAGTTVIMLISEGYLATKELHANGDTEFLKHPDAKPGQSLRFSDE